MMKKFFLIALMSLAAFDASSSEDVRVLGKMELGPGGTALIRSLEGEAIPAMLEGPEVRNDLASIGPGDDVIIDGHITYVGPGLEGGQRLVPFFLIQRVRPVSLARLRVRSDVPEIDRHHDVIREVYAPMAIPVSVKVASSITMTASLLLLQSLTAGPADPELRKDLNAGLITFAGVLATSIFLFEQLTAPRSKGTDHE